MLERHKAPLHEVEITKAFYLEVHQVTQSQWRAVMGSNPSYFCATGGGKKKVKGMNIDEFPHRTGELERCGGFTEETVGDARRKEKRPTIPLSDGSGMRVCLQRWGFY